MKNIKYLILFLFLLFPKVVLADGYSISSYQVDMVVKENNTYDITETIAADFTAYNKHGIIRSIPVKNTIKRSDGTISINNSRISQIKVLGAPYTVGFSNNNYIIKIGDADETVYGNKVYTIKYTYIYGKDLLKDKDELYFNLIGTQWDTTISNVSFSITMPKEFPTDTIGFTTGEYGNDNADSAVSYGVNGLSISGIVNKSLNPYEGLTIRMTLPNNYFKVNNTIDLFTLGIIMFSVLSIIISYLLWLKYGKDPQVIDTVEFYPPEGFNSLELAYGYKGEIIKQDVLSLAVYLANKGYIRIKEAPDRSLIFEKIREYGGNNESERLFMNGIFEGTTVATSASISNSFYSAMEQIKSVVGNSQNENKLFEKNSIDKQSILLILNFIIIGLLFFRSVEYTSFSDIVSNAAITMFMYGIIYEIALKGNSPKHLIYLLGAFFLILYIFVKFQMPSLTYFTLFPIITITSVIAIIINSIFMIIIKKRTQYGSQLLGKINGFKRFLETAEKETLEAEVAKNPTYFYDILPFTYVLGVSDIWMKKFENIQIKSPDWYYSDRAFDMYMFNTYYMNTSYSSFSSSSGGFSSSGSSGGGFSGGGAGGGGGSSW
jgi:uncharacterized membrane protein